jgi:hypothetical protein
MLTDVLHGRLLYIKKNTWVNQKYLTYMYAKLVQMEVVHGLHWMKQQSLLKVVVIIAETGI